MSKYYYRFIVDDEFKVVYTFDITENLCRGVVVRADAERNFALVKRDFDGKFSEGRGYEPDGTSIYLAVEIEVDLTGRALHWEIFP